MGKPLRAATAGNDAEIDFRLAKASVLGGDDDVAAHRQFTAAAQGKAVHRGDHRLANSIDLIAVGEPLLNSFVKRTALGHLFDVGAGGENFLPAGDDEDADLAVLIQF